MSGGKILIGGIQHETNTFSPVHTDLESFRRGQFVCGEPMIERYRSTGTELGGMIDEAERSRQNLTPLLFAVATPAGMVRREAFEDIVRQLCERAAAHRGTASGILMALHGAMVAEHIDEADAEVLVRLRAAAGGEVPIVATLDYHANISPALVDAADVLVVYDTFPHVDMADRGRDAARILAHLMAGETRPACAFRSLPILPTSKRQITTMQPMRAIMDAARAARREEGIVWCSVAGGFPFTDVPHLGMSVLSYGDEKSAGGVSDRLAKAIWTHREAYTSTGVSVGDAVELALTSPPPVILVDVAENVGAGAPGDGTAILAELLRRGFTGAVVVLWDPAGAAEAVKAGVGGQFSRAVGGHAGVDNGDPVPLNGTVGFAAPLTYRRTGTYMTGTTVKLGAVAVIEAGGNTVVLTTERWMPFDADLLRTLEIRAEEHQAIVVKSGSAWRAAFGDVAGTIIDVNAPGVTTQEFHRLAYAKRPRPLFPLER
jgi:microcystin degradation protein MlrC